MITRLRSILLSVAAASFLANGAHALTGPSAQRVTSGVDPQSIRYQRSGSTVFGVTFRMATEGRKVRIRVNPADGWHLCSVADQAVSCTLSARPVTTVNELVIQSI
jgi:hypothetical protein